MVAIQRGRTAPIAAARACWPLERNQGKGDNSVTTTRLLYFGDQWEGSTSLQRQRAFQQLQGVTVAGVDARAGAANNVKGKLWHKVRWKLRIPVDAADENRLLTEAVQRHRPDIVVVDNSRVIRHTTLKKLRRLSPAVRLVYYSPDDIVARHNLSLPLKRSLPYWDTVCTTKTFNIPELEALGVQQAQLVGKAFDPSLHRPLDRSGVDAEFEHFDAVFVGTYEDERCASINALAANGVSIVVYGHQRSGWRSSMLHDSIELRPAVFAEDYVHAWHTGKVALCFLRKINRDRITQRSMEIAAMGRPMVAERTDEHDQHFAHGKEYLGFASDTELFHQVRQLLDNEPRRIELGKAARRRCLDSGYSSLDRAHDMISIFRAP